MPVMPTARPLPDTSATTLGTVVLGDRERQRSTHGEVAVHRGCRLAAAHRPSHALQLADELELLARLHDPLEAHVLDPGEEGELAAVRLLGEDGDGAGLRH